MNAGKHAQLSLMLLECDLPVGSSEVCLRGGRVPYFTAEWCSGRVCCLLLREIPSCCDHSFLLPKRGTEKQVCFGQQNECFAWRINLLLFFFVPIFSCCLRGKVGDVPQNDTQVEEQPKKCSGISVVCSFLVLDFNFVGLFCPFYFSRVAKTPETSLCALLVIF